MDSEELKTRASKEPRMIRRLTLPHFGKTPPGPLHTLVKDTEGNLYYSDEINHSVVSLTAGGSVRWQRTKKGSASGEFWYPRGLSLGCIQLKGKILDCIAVADAWNRRVQLLDLEGNQLAIWTRGGKSEFGEITDVQFIPGCEGSADFWYVLDRGESCLWKISPDGTVLDRIGRLFPSNLQNCWAATAVFFSSPDQAFDDTSKFSPLDFTFYPLRILGNSSESLFISEDGSRKLKQVLPPHLIPLCLDSPDTAEWIAADSSYLLVWDRNARQLIRRTGTGSECDLAEVDGNPIHSNLSLECFWLQTEEHIEEWKWDLPADRSTEELRERYLWLVLSAQEAIKQLDPALIRESVGNCLKHLDDEIQLGSSILAMSENGIPPEYEEEMSRHAVEFTVKCACFVQRVQKVLNHWSLGQLALRIARSPRYVPSKQAADLEQLKKELANQIAGRIPEIQKKLEALNTRLSSLSTDRGGDQPSPDLLIHIAKISRSNLEHGKEWLESWSGIQAQNNAPES